MYLTSFKFKVTSSPICPSPLVAPDIKFPFSYFKAIDSPSILGSAINSINLFSIFKYLEIYSIYFSTSFKFEAFSKDNIGTICFILGKFLLAL